VNCRQQVEDLNAVDPLIKRVFHHDLAIARVPRTRRSLGVYAGVATTAVAGIILLVAITLSRLPVTEAPPPVQATAPVPEVVEPPKVVKVPVSPAINRAKPDVVSPDLAQRQGVSARTPVAAANAPDFMVMDTAGYSRTLDNYRGYILVFGVVTPERAQAIANLERVYQTFGGDSKLRILGITLERGLQPGTATFPSVQNQGSTLMGATDSDLLIVDQFGTVRWRGSLLDDTGRLLSSIQTTLNQLR
jgi:hypothetical protein